MLINNKGLSICLVILTVIGGLALFQSRSVAEEKAAAPVKAEVATLMKDRVLGKADAPITMIEYASMTCPHCAHFALDILPKVKEKLIETGKVKLVFREFPMDQFGLKASMMARCLPEDKFFGMIETIFSNQARWTSAKEPVEALAQLAALAGMDRPAFDACLDNKDLETALLAGVQTAQEKYALQSTPTFIMNEGAGRVDGAQDIDAFEKEVAKILKGK